MDQAKIGKFIAECRKDKGITQEELAELLGVSNRSISRWENGKNMPDYVILKDLCKILGIDVNEFLNGEKIKKEEIPSHSIENLDLILQEYYKMKNKKNLFKRIAIVLGILTITLIIKYIKKTFLGIGLILAFFGVLYADNQRQNIITTDTKEYNEVIGSKANKKYQNKYGMPEEIFPETVNNLNVLDFKMVYSNSLLNSDYLAYLVVDYNQEDYTKEMERLSKFNIYEYCIESYDATGFSNYELIALKGTPKHGFIYALTDGKSKIIYVEFIFPSYNMQIDYENEVPNEYLPVGLNVKEGNPYDLKYNKD